MYIHAHAQKMKVKFYSYNFNPPPNVMTLLYAEDQVIISNNKNNLYELSKISEQYNMKISKVTSNVNTISRKKN
jgi:hypothetical protein